MQTLGNFDGTMLFVSHDRQFLRALSNRVLEVGEGGVPRAYGGGYVEYVGETGREALRTITERGLLVRRPGAGSVVVASETPTAFTQSVKNVEELMNYPPDTFRENVSSRLVVADKALAHLLDCEAGTRWFRISAIRRTNSSPEPLGWTDIYLLPRYSKVVDAVDHAQTHVYQQVERLFGEPTVRARFEIFASRIPTRLARPLKVASGTPALTFVRRYFGANGENFENSVTVHPEHRFTYTMDVQREPRKPRRG